MTFFSATDLSLFLGRSLLDEGGQPDTVLTAAFNESISWVEAKAERDTGQDIEQATEARFFSPSDSSSTLWVDRFVPASVSSVKSEVDGVWTETCLLYTSPSPRD